LKLHTVKGTEKRNIEHKIKRYNDYQSAGLITFLISSPQHVPPAVLIENKSISKYLTYIADLKVKATPLQIHLKLKETIQYDTNISLQHNSHIVY